MDRSISICVDAMLEFLSHQIDMYRYKTRMSRVILKENYFCEITLLYVSMHDFLYLPKRFVHEQNHTLTICMHVIMLGQAHIYLGPI